MEGRQKPTNANGFFIQEIYFISFFSSSSSSSFPVFRSSSFCSFYFRMTLYLSVGFLKNVGIPKRWTEEWDRDERGTEWGRGGTNRDSIRKWTCLQITCFLLVHSECSRWLMFMIPQPIVASTTNGASI